MMSISNLMPLSIAGRIGLTEFELPGRIACRQRQNVGTDAGFHLPSVFVRLCKEPCPKR